MSESIIFFCTVAGLIIAALTYYLTFVKPHKQNVSYLLDKAATLRTKTAQLRNDLTQYANENNTMDQVFMQDLTFAQCIGILAKSEYHYYSEENLTAIKKAKAGKHFSNLVALYEDQLKHVNYIQTLYDLYLNQK